MEAKDRFIVQKFIDLPWMLISIVTLLSFIGSAMLYSAAGGYEPWAIRHAERFIVGLVAMLIVALVDIRFWFKYAYLFYFVSVSFLLLVEIMGFIGMGAQRWVNIGGINFQPSEVMKITLTLALARHFHCVHLNNLKSISMLAIPVLLVIVPVALILKQPNLGTASLITFMGIAMFFAAGVNIKKFVLAGIAGAASLPVVWHFMHSYQKQRVLTFLNPESDPLGSGYNIIQSKIAIGSGGFSGKGFLNGSQSQLSFLPEKQTDFIFTMLAEEFGFLGGIGLIILYAAIIIITIRIAAECYSHFAKLVCFGISTMIFLHVFINMGMTMGMLPVVGVPLPLLSYGGSNLISALIGLGFVLNAKVHSKTRVDRAIA